MSFTLWMHVRADAATVYARLADIGNATSLSPIGNNSSSTMVAGCSWQRQMRQVYLRSQATFRCLVADEDSGILQWEMNDGFHMAETKCSITELGTGVRLQVDVSCYIIIGGGLTPSDELAAMMKRDEIKRMQAMNSSAESSFMQHDGASATCQQTLVCQQAAVV